MNPINPTNQLSGVAAIAAADAVIDDLIVAAVASSDRARVTDAPAGAGKTGGVVKLVGALADSGARVGVVLQTNAQAFDVVERLAAAHPTHTVSFMPSSKVQLPGAIANRVNVQSIKVDEVMSADIVVATADKWSFSQSSIASGAFDAGIIDEAYQMTSAKLLRVADLFASLDFIGDPGQLDPFSTVDDEKWAGLRTNPVLNSVDALLAHHPQTPRRSLPVTRRLPASAAGVIRDVFYPELSFGPSTGPGDRRLEFTALAGPSRATARADAAWAMAAARGWAYVRLPARASLQVDSELVGMLADLTQRLFQRGTRVFDERTGPGGRPLAQNRVAVGVAHRDQRAAVSMALEQRGLTSVVVDTANGLQGQEYDLVLVWHPLAGRTDATDFHLDAGRMCVLTTRHRQACIVVGRAGTADLLDKHPPPGRVTLGISRDTEFDGWEAHVKLLEHLGTVTV